ncbi:beta-glucosidase BglX [Psychroflexus montanilacus]|uniref:beta-glucosidase BglX n=1 Tax=Psychroflexus montanilacus TaxID=2873598 RepID=UPI001CCD43BD|nr:beta-glucosidase BglX [Psychroflexus montanilacus]MBZ9651699.1 beta-glucosidase BglX [Psychroflexus montanilacus]
MKLLILGFVAILFIGCQQDPSLSNKTEESNIDQQVEELLAEMTLEEKIGQLNQYSGFMDFTGPQPNKGRTAKKLEHIKNGKVGAMLNVHGVDNVRAVQKMAVKESRLGIPLLFGFDVVHGYKTISPIPIAEAASWDLEAMRRSAEIAAEEASASGINWTFAPMVDISRDARWGRVMEGAGEDPYLGSQIAKARVKGFQGEDLSKTNTIAATAKHFAAYGFAEAGREYNTVDIGTSTLYNVVLPPFKAAVDADVKSIMNAFNVLNGIPATGDKFLLRDILKDKWNFDGFVVSDWDSVGEMVAHGFAEDGREAAKQAAIAGSDMDMESYHFVEELQSLVEDGEVDEELINDAARRILRVKYELGLFEDPYKYCSEEREKETLYNPKFRADVLDIAKKSIVLLKNQNDILPVKTSGQNIAVIGALADDKTSPLGSWRIGADDESAISVLEGIEKYDQNKYTYSKGADVVTGETQFTRELKVNTTDKSGFNDAISIAKSADVVIMVLGEHGLQSGEARSRTRLDLPGVQQELLEEVYEVNQNIVLVLQNGRPLALPWADEHIPGIVEAWQLGTESGNAIAEVLFGDYNPSGKLPMTFPRHVGQVPIYYNKKSTGRPELPSPGEVFWSHYTDEQNSSLYPFGFGLSYTSFSFKHLIIENNHSDDGTVSVSVEVSNTGKRKGKTTVQLYLQDEFASVTRPVKELKVFEQVELDPGESREIKFQLRDKDLGFYNNSGEFVVEKGSFKVYVGEDSHADLSGEFQL